MTGERVWRIARAAHRKLNGRGSERYGGRWNSRGVPVVYTASTAPLAVLEALVHVDPDDVPDDMRLMAIDLPADLGREVVNLSDLPAGWQATPAPDACRALGDAWCAAGRAALLVVPSAIVPEAVNVLINPRHPDAARLRVAESRAFSFDLRLL